MEPAVEPETEAVELPRSAPVIARAYFLGIVLLLFAGYLAYCAFTFGTNGFESADAKRVKEREKILSDRLAEDAKWLHDKPGWFKKDQGLIRVPIDEAMRMTIPELAAVAPHPAEPITANPPPAASPAPAGGAASPSPAAAAPTPPAGASVPLPGASPSPAAAASPSPNVSPAPSASPAPSVAPSPAAP